MMFLKALEIDTAGAVIAPNLYSTSLSHGALSLSPDGDKDNSSCSRAKNKN